MGAATPGRASWTARNAALAGPHGDTDLTGVWDYLDPEQRDAEEAGAQAAIEADPRWPRCPDGCGCRLGTEDADRADCGCDGPCTIECRENGYPDAPSYRDQAVKHLMDERGQIRAELDRAGEFARRLERVMAAWTRGMYSAWIDCRREDALTAARTLWECLDGFDGTPWNGTETGAEWMELVRAQDVLSGAITPDDDDPDAVATRDPEAALERVRNLAQDWGTPKAPGDLDNEIAANAGRALLGVIHGGTGSATERLAVVTGMAEDWLNPGASLFYPSAGRCVLDAIKDTATRGGA